MARKQNKSVKVAKKDSAVSLNTKRGGKVTKKPQDIKAKKINEAKLKQAVKIQGKQNKKPVSPVNARRRSNHNSEETTKKTSTPALKNTNIRKGSSTAKSKPSRTVKGTVKSASKRKSDSVEKPENRKRASIKDLQILVKNEQLPEDTAKAGNKRGLRGKKRNYVQLASGSKTEGNNVSKKRKTVDSPDLTSRGSRSIKPTVKGSEWRNTILQKKSANVHQDKTSRKVAKISNTPKSPAAANKSPGQRKKALPRKSSESTKPAERKAERKDPKSPRQKSGSRRLTEKKTISSPSKTKVKTTIDSPSSKSPKKRRASKRSPSTSEENKNCELKANSLATSIKNKFNLCVSNKKNLEGNEVQENILVAKGILDDILGSVGTSGICPTDVILEDKDSTTDAVKKVFEQNEGTCKVNQETEDSSQPINTGESESMSSQKLMGEEKLVSSHEGILDSNSVSEVNESIELKKSIIVHNEISNNEDGDKSNVKYNEKDEMELHLSDTSETSVSDDLVSQGNISVFSTFNSDTINTTNHNSKNIHLVDSDRSEMPLNKNPENFENNFSAKLQSDKSLNVKDSNSICEPTETPSKQNGILETKMDLKGRISSEKDKESGESSAKKSYLTQPTLSPNKKTSVSKSQKSVFGNDLKAEDSFECSKELGNADSCQDNNNDLTNLKCEASSKKKEDESSVNLCRTKISESEVSLQETNGAFNGHDKVDEMQLSCNGSTNKVENCIDKNLTSDSDFASNQDGKNSSSNLKEAISVRGDTCIIDNHTTTLENTPGGPILKANIFEAEVLQTNIDKGQENDPLTTDGDGQMSSSINLQKIKEIVSKSDIHEFMSPSNKNSLELSKEIKTHEILVNKENPCPLDSHVSLQEKDNFTSHKSVESGVTKDIYLERNDATTVEGVLKKKKSSSQELHEDKQTSSQILPLNPVFYSNVDEEKKISKHCQENGSEIVTDSDKCKLLHSVNDKLPLQELETGNQLSSQEIQSDHFVDSSMCDEVSLIVKNSKEKIADGIITQGKQFDIEAFREAPSNICSQTAEDNILAGQRNSSEKIHVESHSSALKEVNIGDLENISDSSNNLQSPFDGKFSSEDSTGDKKSHSDENVSPQTSLINSESSCPLKEITCSDGQDLADTCDNKEACDMMISEEGNVEESAQNSIVADKQSFPYISNTTNTTEIKEEGSAGKEVGSEEMVATGNTFSGIETNMEVS